MNTEIVISATPRDGRRGHYPLMRGEVHIWCALLLDLHPHLKQLAECLPTSEISRAARFFSEKDRINYTLAHGFLRSVLGFYLDSPAHTSPFFVDGLGRPSISKPGTEEDMLHFSLSRSHEAAVCALGCANSVGVDIERIEHLHDSFELMEFISTPHEREVFSSLPMSQRDRAIYLLWVCKEALLKAEGSGLGIHPRDLEVGPMCWNEANFSIKTEKHDYFVNTFEFATDYIAAFAMTSRPDDIQFTRFKFPLGDE